MLTSWKSWLGRRGSNLRMAGSKSAALPLGYAPSPGPPCGGRAGRTIVSRGRAGNGARRSPQRRCGPVVAAPPTCEAAPARYITASVAATVQVCGGLGSTSRERVGRSVAQPGSALASGARGREFRSPRSDQFFQLLVNRTTRLGPRNGPGNQGVSPPRPYPPRRHAPARSGNSFEGLFPRPLSRQQASQSKVFKPRVGVSSWTRSYFRRGRKPFGRDRVGVGGGRPRGTASGRRIRGPWVGARRYSAAAW